MPYRQNEPSRRRRANAKTVGPQIVGRRTAPTATGKQYPILFGPGATPVLMYLAMYPGSSPAEVGKALEIKRLSWDRRINRLRHYGIVVGLRYYQINPMLENATWLRRALLRMAEECGMEGRKTGRAWAAARKLRTAGKSVPVPLELFTSPVRARALMVLAGIGEGYPREVALALKLIPSRVSLEFQNLVDEGVLRMRKHGYVKLYSFDPEFCAHRDFLRFLRRTAMHRRDIMDALTALFLSREVRRAAGTTLQRKLVESMVAPPMTLKGIAKRDGLFARQKLIAVKKKKPRR